MLINAFCYIVPDVSLGHVIVYNNETPCYCTVMTSGISLDAVNPEVSTGLIHTLSDIAGWEAGVSFVGDVGFLGR